MSPIPPFQIQLTTEDHAALLAWRAGAEALQGRMLRADRKLAKAITQRDQLAEKIQALNSQATKASAAAKLPGLQTQLQALEEEIEILSQGSETEKFKPEVVQVNRDLAALLRKAARPSFDRAVAAVAAPLVPYYRHPQSAPHVVSESDYFKFVAGQLFSELTNFPLSHSLRLASAVLRGELPFPYQPSPAPGNF